MSNLMASLRISFYLEGSDHRLALVAPPDLTVLQLRRRVEAEYSDLFNQHFIVGRLIDSQGFVLSNSGVVGQLLSSGAVVKVQRQKVDFQKRLSVGKSAVQAVNSLRWVGLSTSKRLREMDLDDINPQDLIGQLMALGFSYQSKQTVLNSAVTLRRLFQKKSANFLKSLHTSQKAIMHMLQFWLNCLLPTQSELLPQIIDIIDQLTQSSIFSLSKSPQITGPLLEYSNKEEVSLALKGRILQTISGLGKIQLDQSQRQVSQHFQDPSRTFLQANLQMLVSRTYQIRLNALKQLNQLLPTLERVGSQQVIRLFKVFQIKMDKLTTPLIQSLMPFLEKYIHSQKIAERLVETGILQRIHENMLASTNQKQVDSLSRILVKLAVTSKYKLSQRDVIAFLKSPYQVVQNLSCRTISFNSQIPQFITPSLEPIVKMLLVWVADQKRTLNSRTNSITALANFSVNDALRKCIINNKGITVLTQLLITTQLQIARGCAKTLLNLSLSSRQIKLKIVSQLPEGLVTGEVVKDSVVRGYIESLLSRK